MPTTSLLSLPYAIPLVLFGVVLYLAYHFFNPSHGRYKPRYQPARPIYGKLSPNAPSGIAKNRDAEPLPPNALYRKNLLTPWELSTLKTLDATLPHGLRACPQVTLREMIKVQISDPSLLQTTINRIGNKSVDFAIVDDAGNVQLVIELNDDTHTRPSRIHRDRLVADALAQAMIPLAIFKPFDPIDVRPWLGQYRSPYR